MRKIIFIIGLTAIIALFLGMYFQKFLNSSIVTIIETTDENEAEGVLITFLDSLYEKDYDAATAVYGGDYDQLRDWNPDVEPTDLALLWKRGCEQNGLQCMEIRNTDFASQPDKNMFFFNVWFNNPDRISEFTQLGGTSMFSFAVIKTDQKKYLVITMPVYTP
ncbi:TPA: hypothetical protein DEP34_03200 [Candidatus Uhrbacteria bacterium]|uniref:Uncharacterized protein n=2 Tax=Candidatus Uhriibacteriota TaxID=1752732 RepID=A0A0G1T7F0_9BACT|nr:MAG: hypothetical protein UX45_C0001G0081 [Candidatus Uhrbacteria bacterium GW2011_GWF2_46_218]KKU41355.1 MAG: hypothetical protein UX57_C0004G0059 [Candidatus Uhrbacteria bacterium GW2011_GWE2_46_68]HBK33789.1 hypothetical protein [Candidatus Uhrbacteria bacterium]HCB19370.1 hypothetical protein [Candidatus Uhrbacteria bacterium]